MDNLSKQDKERVVVAIERAVKLANEGSTPDDALYKVAEEEKLKPEMVKRVVEAFNTSKTLAHLKHAGDDDRADSFDIASAELILGKLYPSEVETEEKKAMAGLHPSYRTRDIPDFSKAAEAALPPMTDKKAELQMSPQAAWTKASKERSHMALMLKEAEDTFREVFMKLWSITKEASNYWRQAAQTEDFDLVEKRAYATYGPPVRHVMDMIYKMGDLGSSRTQIKRAAPEELGTQQMHFDATVEPYAAIADAMLMAKTATYCRRGVLAAKDMMAKHACANVHAMAQPVVEEAIEWLLKTAKADPLAFIGMDKSAQVRQVYNEIKHGKPAAAEPRRAAALDDLFAKGGSPIAGITGGGIMTAPPMKQKPSTGSPVPVPAASPTKNPAAPAGTPPAGSGGIGGGVAPAATSANQKLTPSL